MEGFREISPLYSLAQNNIFLGVYITLYTIKTNDVIALQIST
jgi:hypothetical protein